MLRRLLVSALVVCALAGCSGSTGADSSDAGPLPDSTNAQPEPTCRAFGDAIEGADGRSCSPQQFPAGYGACREAWPHCTSRDRSLILQATNCLNQLPQCTPQNQVAFEDSFTSCLNAFLGGLSAGCFGE